MPSLLDQNVPIVGRGVRVIGYTVLPLVMCDCGNMEPIALVAQVATGNVFRVARDVSDVPVDVSHHRNLGRCARRAGVQSGPTEAEKLT